MDTDNKMEELYRERMSDYLQMGDDIMNAELRIIEDGCPIPLARKLAKEQEEADEDE